MKPKDSVIVAVPLMPARTPRLAPTRSPISGHETRSCCDNRMNLPAVSCPNVGVPDWVAGQRMALCARSVHGAGGHDPLAWLAGHGGDAVEVRVVVKDREVSSFGSGRDEQVG